MSDDAARGRPAPADRGNDVWIRIASGAAMALVALAAAVIGGWAAAFVLAVVTAIVHLEWASLTDRSPWPTAVFTVSLIIALTMITLGLVGGAMTIIGLAVMASALTISIWRPIGVLYAAVVGAGLLLLRLSPDGLSAILVLFAVVWGTDTGAYAFGRTIGGAKLWPAVSPGKTWAGAVGGLAAGLVAGFAVSAWLAIPIGAPLTLTLIGLSLAAQAGDLFESAVKRRFGAKDAGTIIPGHGGLMDRVDGLVFATGLAVLTGWLHGCADLARGLLWW